MYPLRWASASALSLSLMACLTGATQLLERDPAALLSLLGWLLITAAIKALLWAACDESR